MFIYFGILFAIVVTTILWRHQQLMNDTFGGTKRFYAKNNDPYKGMSFSEQADAEIDEVLKANAKDWEELISRPSTENKNGVYRDPHLYNDKTGKRSYRVKEMRFGNHTEFRAEYFIEEGDDRWYTFNERKMVYYSNGGSNLEWVPIVFKSLEEARNYCEEDKKKLRNETLLETITHIV